MATSIQASGIRAFTAAADSYTGRMVIKKIRWVGATTAAHACIIHDSDGKIIYHGLANAANYVEDVDFCNLNVDGVVINTLGSGTVYIYG